MILSSSSSTRRKMHCTVTPPDLQLSTSPFWNLAPLDVSRTRSCARRAISARRPAARAAQSGAEAQRQAAAAAAAAAGWGGRKDLGVRETVDLHVLVPRAVLA